MHLGRVLQWVNRFLSEIYLLPRWNGGSGSFDLLLRVAASDGGSTGPRDEGFAVRAAALVCAGTVGTAVFNAVLCTCLIAWNDSANRLLITAMGPPAGAGDVVYAWSLLVYSCCVLAPASSIGVFCVTSMLLARRFASIQTALESGTGVDDVVLQREMMAAFLAHYTHAHAFIVQYVARDARVAFPYGPPLDVGKPLCVA